MNARPVPVVSRRYLFDAAPPNTIELVRPASRATLAKEKPIDGAASWERADDPVHARTAAASQTLAVTRETKESALQTRRFQVRGEAMRRLEFGPRFLVRAVPAQSERELKVRLRVVGREPHRLADGFNRGRDVV